MNVKEYMKYPKKQLIKLAVDRKLITWEEGNRMSRDNILGIISNA